MLFLLLAFEKKIKKTFFYAHSHLWRCASAGKQECTAHFFFLFQFLHYLSIGEKERGKWMKTTLNTSCQQIKHKTKRNAPVLRTFKYENDDDQDLGIWRKPIMLSWISHEWALSSLRSLVRRPVEHEKRNSEFTRDHVLFCLLSKRNSSLPANKVDFINEWKHRILHPRKKS